MAAAYPGLYGRFEGETRLLFPRATPHSCPVDWVYVHGRRPRQLTISSGLPRQRQAGE